MYALDTNILVYAYNLTSPQYKKAKKFLEKIIAEEDKGGNPVVGIPLQVCAEFINVCTRETVGKPLSISEAVAVITEYSDLEIPIIFPKSTQLHTFLELLKATKNRKKVFDVFLASTLKDNNVEGFYTVNVDDFKDFGFLKIANPLA